MAPPHSRSLERRSSTRWRPRAGFEVRIRRVGRRTERPGVVRDLSPTGAMIEIDKWLPLGTLLHLTFPTVNDSALVTVVRSTLSDEFARRYGVACVHSELPFSDLYTANASNSDDDSLHSPFGVQWPTTRNDIRRIYRSLARKLHPDVGGTDDHFRSLHQSYLDAMAVAAR